MMSSDSPSPHPAPTLDNCDREPIHIPGSIQPHGALLAFDRLGRLSHASANAAELLKIPVQFGRILNVADFEGKEDVYDLIQQAIADASHEEHVSPASLEARFGDDIFDVVVHSNAGFTLCEFESREVDSDTLASFAQKAYRSMDAIKRQRSTDRLLESAAREVRALTGFDRVMAYRFRHDDSGDVVAEARRDDLEAYVGRRYPASDIPAQARRLYILNTLRLIADVAYSPVPLLAAAGHADPLDLSHAVLRSVSPIHVEYLGNMGVAASLSVSIVVGGKLWGMIACHHLTPRQVPYSIRMAIDVLAQLLASSVQSLQAQHREAAIARAAVLRTEILSRVSQGEDVLDVLAAEAIALRDSLGCDAVIATLDGKVRKQDPIDEPYLQGLMQSLAGQSQPLVHVTRCDDLQLAAPTDGGASYCGVLALRFDGPRQGWLVGLKREQIETIRWGGKPDKELKHGPLGPRLTPRGSFNEWREIVLGTAAPWNDTQLEIASQLLDAVSRVHTERVLQLDQLRSQLWAILGHDLRNPLQSLSVAAKVLDRGDPTGRMNTVIRNSTNRMQRLISDVLDISRMQNGLGMGMDFRATDLVALTGQLIMEAEVAHAGLQIRQDLPAALIVDIDSGRFSQVLANLLSNARHHGEQGEIVVTVRQEGDVAALAVTNPGQPIPAEVVHTLFDPFKRQTLVNERNRNGMGLGLYIAHQIVEGHQGTLVYHPGQGTVTFEVRLPLSQTRSPA